MKGEIYPDDGLEEPLVFVNISVFLKLNHKFMGIIIKYQTFFLKGNWQGDSKYTGCFKGTVTATANLKQGKCWKIY